MHQVLVRGERPASEKLGHSEVDFQKISHFDGESCKACEHYIPAFVPRCMAVEFPIYPGAWCKRFEDKE